MNVTGMNHFTILSRDIDETRRFYTEILGLKEGPRPDLGFPGIWFYVGEQWVLHVVAGRKMPSPPAGVIDHIAFSAADINATVARLKKHGIAYRLFQQTGTKVWQIFFDDPNGAKVELDFDPSEVLATP
ncbi:MAG: VOC family protein [Proteobacteria bacterium]|nr:VOC family protein [Pseudomonadota bacterium]